MPQHSRHVLRRVAKEHVAYELRTLGGLAEIGAPDPLTSSALLEAYLVHVRALNEFLTTPRKKTKWPQLVVARHYFDGEWSGVTCLSEKDRFRIDRTIAHITSDRRKDVKWASANSRRGDWAEMVLDAFGCFIADLAEVHPARAAWFRPGFEDGRSWLYAAKRGQISVETVKLPRFLQAQPQWTRPPAPPGRS